MPRRDNVPANTRRGTTRAEREHARIRAIEDGKRQTVDQVRATALEFNVPWEAMTPRLNMIVEGAWRKPERRKAREINHAVAVEALLDEVTCEHPAPLTAPASTTLALDDVPTLSFEPGTPGRTPRGVWSIGTAAYLVVTSSGGRATAHMLNPHEQSPARDREFRAYLERQLEAIDPVRPAPLGLPEPQDLDSRNLPLDRGVWLLDDDPHGLAILLLVRSTREAEIFRIPSSAFRRDVEGTFLVLRIYLDEVDPLP